MPSLLVWLLVPGLMFIGFGLLGGSSLAVRRRPRFWIRVSLQCLGMVAAVLVLFGALELKLLPLHVVMVFWLVLVVGALVVAPVSCYRSAGSSDEGGGGGTDPLPPPSGPHAGTPLPDATQSDARVRDHAGPKPHHPRPRRALGSQPECGPRDRPARARTGG